MFFLTFFMHTSVCTWTTFKQRRRNAMGSIFKGIFVIKFSVYSMSESKTVFTELALIPGPKTKIANFLTKHSGTFVLYQKNLVHLYCQSVRGSYFWPLWSRFLVQSSFAIIFFISATAVLLRSRETNTWNNWFLSPEAVIDEHLKFYYLFLLRTSLWD